MSNVGSLRAIKESELELMRSWRNAPGVRANMYTRHEIAAEEHLAWWAKISKTNTARYFMYENEGVPLGIVGFTDIDLGNGNSSWAFYASPAAPKGTGSKMELLALDYAFGDLALHKLHCEVLAFNKAVINLHRKFGFTIEGILREQHRNDSEYVDVYRFGIMKKEWDLRRDEMIARIGSHEGAGK